MIMVREQNRVDMKSRRIAATGGVVGFSVGAILLGVSLVVLSLRKTRVQVELKEKD